MRLNFLAVISNFLVISDVSHLGLDAWWLCITFYFKIGSVLFLLVINLQSSLVDILVVM